MSETPRHMVVVTQREVIQGVASAWRHAYYVDRKWGQIAAGSSETVYRKLMKLDLATATSADVEAIIGNDSWSTVDCDACERNVTAIVRVDRWEDPRGSALCADCLTAGLALLAKVPA